MQMIKLSLFSGIGGDDLASDAAGIETICFVERDPNCRKVLSAHWPDVPIIEDVKDVTKEKVMAYADAQRQQQQEGSVENIRGRTLDRSKTLSDSKSQQDRGLQFLGVSPDIRTSSESGIGIDIISGGFPCQPHSVAGLRKGTADERDLWPQFRRIIGEINPRWVVAENVPGLFSTDDGRFFRAILRDLSEMGYSVGWCTFGAVDVGAWHRRDRIFIVAYSKLFQYGRTESRSIIKETESKGSIGASLNTSGELSGTGESRGSQGYEEINGETLGAGMFSGASQDATGSTKQGLERAISEGSAQTGGLSAECGDVAYAESSIRRRSNGENDTGRGNTETRGQGESTRGLQYRQFEPRMGNVVDGFPTWLAEPDGVPRVASGIKARVAKLKALGNAVVPAQIYQVYKAIVGIEGSF